MSLFGRRDRDDAAQAEQIRQFNELLDLERRKFVTMCDNYDEALRVMHSNLASALNMIQTDIVVLGNKIEKKIPKAAPVKKVAVKRPAKKATRPAKKK